MSAAPSSYVCQREETALGNLPSGTFVVKSSEKVSCQPGRSAAGMACPEGLGAAAPPGGCTAPAAVTVTVVVAGRERFPTRSTARAV